MQHSQQMLVISPDPAHVFAATLQRYTRDSTQAAWHLDGGSIPVTVGVSGVSRHKRERDNRTPVGAFALGEAFGFENSINTKLSYLALRDSHQCVDDSNSIHYNNIVDAKTTRVDWRSAENMRTFPQYRMGINILYNHAPTHKNAGSCIFLHVWSSPTQGTAGCIAMSADNLQHLLAWLDPKKTPIIVVLDAHLLASRSHLK